MSCLAALGLGGGGAYTVRSGDNLTTIAERSGTSVAALASANHLDPRTSLRLGARLVIPGATGTSSIRLPHLSERLALVPHFQRWASANHLPVDLLMATTWLESGWQNTVVSPVGAIGIGQLMPDTVDFVRTVLIGVPSLAPQNPEQNIRMSARYLRWLLDVSGGDVRSALAGYYQGSRSVRERGPLPETLAYVNVVVALRHLFAA